mgnify:CR=1 FL=1
MNTATQNQNKLLAEAQVAGRTAQIEFNAIMVRLESLAEQIKRTQDKRSGDLTLSFYYCGKNCIGCPHPRWELWSRKVNRKTQEWFLASQLSKAPRKTGAYRKPSLRPLIDEAMNLINERKSLISSCSRFNSAIRLRIPFIKNPNLNWQKL